MSAAGASRAERLAAFREGAAAMLPTTPANLAWALVTGVAMAQSGLAFTHALGLSLLPYAGSAQLAALPFLVAGAPIWISVLTALMVNLRFVIYSAALSPSLRALPLRQRLGCGYLLGDLVFVIYMRREAELRGSPTRGWYYFGISAMLFSFWHVGSLVGLIAAAAIPRSWGLEFAGLLALVALFVPTLASRPALVGSLTAAALSVALQRLPYRLGLPLAILAGIAAALGAERLRLRLRVRR